jgi:hypothetical protein
MSPREDLDPAVNAPGRSRGRPACSPGRDAPQYGTEHSRGGDSGGEVHGDHEHRGNAERRQPQYAEMGEPVCPLKAADEWGVLHRSTVR